MKPKGYFLFAYFLFIATLAFAGVAFSDIDINTENEILFLAEQNVIGVPAYKTLCTTSASSNADSYKILTCFPEKIDIAASGKAFDIRNRYGTARYTFSDGSLKWIYTSKNIPSGFTRTSSALASPDGNWLCYIKKTGAASGDLILRNLNNFAEAVIASDLQFSYEKVPVKWAPDSAVILYEHNDSVYFIRPEDAFSKLLLSENIRKIGNGTINSVSWTAQKQFLYINGDLIYRISEAGLYTRGLYSSLIGTGTAAGRLAYQFNSAEDCFWASPHGESVVLCQKKRLFTYSRVSRSDFLPVTPIFTIPFNDPKGTIYNTSVFWTPLAFDGTGEEKPVFWINLISAKTGKLISRLYRLDKKMTLISDEASSLEPLISPDGLYMAFTSGNNLHVYNLRTLSLKASLTGEKIVSFAWKDKTTLIAGGVNTVRSFSIEGENPSEKLLFLSSADNAFWDSTGKTITAVKKENSYVYNAEKNTWFISPASSIDENRRHVVQNGRYRVFVGESFNRFFDNAIYVRSLLGSPDNRILFAGEKAENPSESKRLAIVFDALDNACGIADILATLDSYSLKATFFVNGEFVRRYPLELKQIIAQGHECASMFYTASDLTEQYGFVIDSDFIKRGLAREEDEFFDRTGSELSLFWHAPFYKVTEEMKQSGAEAGYTYIQADLFGKDTMSFEECYREKKQYHSVSDIVTEYVSKLHDMAVLSVSTGLSSGSRSDYLYEHLELLISAVLEKGYSIVPIQELYTK